MYATSGIEHIIGVPSEDMVGRSFYSCISGPCLLNVVECLETVKVSGEELIAHLRFQCCGSYTDDESGEDSSYGTKAKSAYGEWRASGAERPLAARAVEDAWQGHGERESPSQLGRPPSRRLSCPQMWKHYVLQLWWYCCYSSSSELSRSALFSKLVGCGFLTPMRWLTNQIVQSGRSVTIVFPTIKANIYSNSFCLLVASCCNDLGVQIYLAVQHWRKDIVDRD